MDEFLCPVVRCSDAVACEFCCLDATPEKLNMVGRADSQHVTWTLPVPPPEIQTSEIDSRASSDTARAHDDIIVLKYNDVIMHSWTQ